MTPATFALWNDTSHSLGKKTMWKKRLRWWMSWNERWMSKSLKLHTLLTLVFDRWRRGMLSTAQNPSMPLWAIHHLLPPESIVIHAQLGIYIVNRNQHKAPISFFTGNWSWFLWATAGLYAICSVVWPCTVIVILCVAAFDPYFNLELMEV